MSRHARWALTTRNDKLKHVGHKIPQLARCAVYEALLLGQSFSPASTVIRHGMSRLRRSGWSRAGNKNM